MSDDSPKEPNKSEGSFTKEDLLRAMYGIRSGKRDKEAEAREKDFKFWRTQPVPALDEKVEDEGAIEEGDLASVKQRPRKLPKPFKWCSVDIRNEEELDEVYELLAEHYVEDDDNMFRFNYSKEFLRWALTPPGYFPAWHIGIRQSDNNKLRAFITGIPVTLEVHSTPGMRMAEINFLCIHKQLRSKGLAPILIKEVTRRVHLEDMWQAVYTAGVVLPRPVARTRYWHRSLQPRKLVEIGFSYKRPQQSMSSYLHLYRLPDEPATPGFRPMGPADVPVVTRLLESYMSQFKVRVQFSEEEVAHFLLPRPGVVSSFVVEGESGVTDFASFYHLPSTVIGNAKHSEFTACYSFYYALSETSLKDLMLDVMVMAKREGGDVFNALDVMQNAEVMEELKFGIGDGNLQYYLYNWRCPEVEAKDLGIVLV